jgi:hypothetical protein
LDILFLLFVLTFQAFGLPILLAAIARGAYKVALPLAALLVLAYLQVPWGEPVPDLPGG